MTRTQIILLAALGAILFLMRRAPAAAAAVMIPPAPPVTHTLAAGPTLLPTSPPPPRPPAPLPLPIERVPLARLASQRSAVPPPQSAESLAARDARLFRDAETRRRIVALVPPARRARVLRDFNNSVAPPVGTLV